MLAKPSQQTRGHFDPYTLTFNVTVITRFPFVARRAMDAILRLAIWSIWRTTCAHHKNTDHAVLALTCFCFNVEHLVQAQVPISES